MSVTGYFFKMVKKTKGSAAGGKSKKDKASIKKNKRSKMIKKKKPVYDYNDVSIKKAFEAVKEKEGMSLREAAEQYGIPKSTLHWRLAHNSVENVPSQS